MMHNKSLSLAAALGLATSLACGSAWATGGGGYEDRDRVQDRQERQLQRGERRTERRGRIRERLEQVGYDVQQIDKNQDGQIAIDEYEEWRESLFGNLDADQNDELTVLEYIVLHPTRMEPKLLQVQFQKLDEDNDGMITKNQYIQQTEDLFKEVDRDGDDKVTTDELEDVLLGRG